ncbi:OmpA family protein [Leptotrichia sp. OH3620_COT-345]|uniref:OmpA family protein n=1 Tax=Leptotrichia sp. OH3620_COT-345 TaxID=2491048 RepID=UPI000F654AB7|nr:OmpA family protein [Leptotrichia sp. OH3620_COT-345]RRD39553.1 OmpA family protein [Leptotrichia sp. OH3620_COT-345]
MSQKLGKTLLMLISVFLLSANAAAVRKLTKEQMRENTIRINALEIDELEVKLKEKSIDDEITVVLDDRALNFDFDKSIVKPQYYSILRNLKEFIEKYDYDVTIVGHTDAKGSNEYNMRLGQRRANSVRNKLLEFGLSSDRIKGVESRGEEEPVATNNTDEGRFRNRRIEFKLVKRK